jgi:hypothetical protein
MSMNMYVCWAGDLPLDRTRLKEGLAAAGFDAAILYDFVGSEGFWPVDIDAFRSGVEIDFLKDLDELRGDCPVLSDVLGERNKGVVFTFGSDWAEGAVACALAAGLGHLGDVVIYEPSAGEVWSPARAADEARQSFELARKDGYRARPPDEEQE